MRIDKMYLGDPIFVAFMSKELKREKDGYRLAHELGLLIYEESGCTL